MDEKTFNGWRNYETRITAQWLNRDSGSSAFWREQAQNCWNTAPYSRRVQQWQWTCREAATKELADRLHEATMGACPLVEVNLYTELLLSAMWDIDWREIAGHYIDEMANDAMDTSGGKTS